jgi:hypothetical protein
MFPGASFDIVFDKFVQPLLRLSESTTASEISIIERKDVILSYSCENYWSLNMEGKGIIFITFSDLISSGLFSTTSIMAFYLGVSYIAGTTIRSMFIYKGDRVFIVDSPNTDALINLINGIFIMRMEKNTKK